MCAFSSGGFLKNLLESEFSCCLGRLVHAFPCNLSSSHMETTPQKGVGAESGFHEVLVASIECDVEMPETG